MSKLQKYNQRLLAIIGTILLTMALIGVIIGVVVWIIELTDKPEPKDGIQATVTNSRTANAPEELVRHQISFNDPIHLDTSRALYLSPVGQVKLDRSEKGNGSFWGSGSSYESSKYRFNSYYGFYNNFVLNDFDEKKCIQIFKKKIVITHWAHVEIQDESLLLFRGVENDLNEDFLLNQDDYQSLYVYDIHKGTLQDFHFDDETVLSFEPLKKTNYVMIKIGSDSNGDFVFDSSSEPQRTLILDAQTKTLKELIPDTMKKSIQNLIE